MTEFWERNFIEKKAMWGNEAVLASFKALEIFKAETARNILIPGFGYGRNAIPFINAGMEITGIEISETALRIANEKIADKVQLFHSSVSKMPLNNQVYDGIFCFSLLHLLYPIERKQFINACYSQLNTHGSLIMVTLSSNDNSFGQGDCIGENWYQSPHGLNLFYYSKEKIEQDFSDFHLKACYEYDESNGQTFWFIHAKKSSSKS